MTAAHANGAAGLNGKRGPGSHRCRDETEHDGAEYEARGAPPPPPHGERRDPLPVAAPWAGVDPAAIPRRRWLYGHYLCRGIVSVLVSPGGVGKSSLAMVEALQLATGLRLHGHALPRGAVRAWYINLEDPREELDRRLAGACKHFDIGYPDLKGRLFINSGIDTPLKLAALNAKGQGEVDADAFEHLEQQIRTNKIDVIIVDPFVSSHSLPENDNTMIDRYIKRWAQSAFRCDVAVQLVHHTKKGPPGQEHDAESARGAKALIDASRSVRVLNPMTKEDAILLNVREDARRQYFRAAVDKQNLAPPAAEKHWYRLASVNLCNGTPPLHMDADLVGVPERWTPPKPEDLVKDGDLARVQDAIDAGEYGAAPQAADWVGNLIAEILGMPMGDKVSRAQIKRLISMWEASGALRREEVYSEKARRVRPVMRVGRREDCTVAQ